MILVCANKARKSFARRGVRAGNSQILPLRQVSPLLHERARKLQAEGFDLYVVLY